MDNDGNPVLWEAPIAEILGFRREGDTTTTEAFVSRPLGDPIAPAGLYAQDESRIVMELHKAVAVSGRRVTFESYETNDEVRVGASYELRQMWDSSAFELVTNLGLVWSRETYPGDGSACDSCPLTYVWFGRDRGDGAATEGYRSGRAWITVDAYERYIRDDILRVRATT